MSVEWTEQMRAIAESQHDDPPAPPLRVDWHRMTTVEGHRLDWQVVGGGASAAGRRLLVVEMDADAEVRVLDAIGALVGRERAPTV